MRAPWLIAKRVDGGRAGTVIVPWSAIGVPSFPLLSAESRWDPWMVGWRDSCLLDFLPPMKVSAITSCTLGLLTVAALFGCEEATTEPKATPKNPAPAVSEVDPRGFLSAIVPIQAAEANVFGVVPWEPTGPRTRFIGKHQPHADDVNCEAALDIEYDSVLELMNDRGTESCKVDITERPLVADWMRICGEPKSGTVETLSVTALDRVKQLIEEPKLYFRTGTLMFGGAFEGRRTKHCVYEGIFWSKAPPQSSQ